MAVVSVSLLVVLGICQLSFGRSLLKLIGLTSTVGSYTALAFQHPQGIPVQLKTAHTIVNVNFAISNASAEVQHYKWNVSVLQGKSVRRPYSGIAYVAPGGKTLITENVKIVCQSGQIQVVVSLAQPAEHIDALMICNA